MTRHDAERKRRILDYIAAMIRATGVPPSVREIARAVGLASTSAVHHHLRALEEDGFLDRGAAQSRMIRLTPKAALQLSLSSELTPQSMAVEAHMLPVIGEIAAGGPIEAYATADEYRAIPDILAPSGDAYLLRVRGDSMIEAAICDGDYVAIRQQPTAENGEIVAAMIDGEATVKTLQRKGGNVWLLPHNPAYDPIDGTHATILGKVTAVLRRV